MAEWEGMRMHIKIVFTDGAEKKEYCREGFRIKEGMLIIPKGRYDPSLYINMQNVREFQECER